MARRSFGLKVFASVATALLIVGFGLDVYVHIRDGHAADSYQNVYGWHIPWTMPATAAVALVVAALVGLLMRWRQLWKRSRQEDLSMSQIAKELKRNG